MSEDNKQAKIIEKSTSENQQYVIDSKLLDFERGKTVVISQIPPKKTSESGKIKK